MHVSSAQLPVLHAEVAAAQEPVFSMERAAKLLLWACLVYQHSDVPGREVPIGDEVLSLLGASSKDPGAAIDDALALLDCAQHRVFWDATGDCKAIVAWGPRTVVVTFRGTATAHNARMDLQVRDPSNQLHMISPRADLQHGQV